MKRLTYAIAALLTTSLLAIAGPPVLSWCPVAYQLMYSWRSPWEGVEHVFDADGLGATCKHWQTPSGLSGLIVTRNLHLQASTPKKVRVHFEAMTIYQPVCTVQVPAYHNRFNFRIPMPLAVNVVPDYWVPLTADTDGAVDVVDINSPQFGMEFESGASNVDGDPMSAVAIRGVWFEILN